MVTKKSVPVDKQERKKVQNALQKEKNILEELVDGAKNITLVYLDRDFNFVRVNKAYAKICGCKPEEIIGKNYFVLYPDEENEGIFKHVRETSVTAEFRDKPFVFSDQPERGVTYWDWTLKPIKSEVGEVEGLILSLVETTERKKAEDAIQHLIQRLEMAQTAAGAGVWDWNVKTGHIEWTPEMFQLFGLDSQKDTASFETWNAVLHPEDREIAGANIDQALRTRSFLDNNYRIVRPDGKIVWINALGKGEYDVKNQPVRMSGICIDITERKKAEQELRKREERYRSYIEVTGELGWTTNAEGEVVEDMPSWRNFTGQTWDEIQGFGWSKALHPDDLEKTLQVWRKAVKEKVKYEVEYRVRRHDGIYRDFMARGVPVFNGDGTLREWVGTCVDITERKKLNEVLLEQSVAISSAPDAIISTDKEFVIKSWNKAAERIFGWTAQEVIGKASTSIFTINYPTLNGVSRKQALDKLMSTGFWRGEVFYHTKKGSAIPVSVSVSLVKGKDDMVIGTVAIIHDISLRKRRMEALEESLKTAKQRAEKLEILQAELEKKAAEVQKYATRMEELADERAMKLKEAERLAAIGATAGMVGHDIRNPLQAIMGELYLIASDVASLYEGEEKESLKESIAAIKRNIEYINKIIKDLQDYAKNYGPYLQEVNVKGLFQQLLMKIDASEIVEVKSYVDEEARMIVSDSALLERILVNLINNAVQAMPDGGVLELGSRKEDDAVVITVQDTGIGIPEDVKDKLFTPLFTTKAKGQGFGLAVVKRMTEALGGKVTFESQENKGTKFIVRLPSNKLVKGK